VRESEQEHALEKDRMRGEKGERGRRERERESERARARFQCVEKWCSVV